MSNCRTFGGWHGTITQMYCASVKPPIPHWRDHSYSNYPQKYNIINNIGWLQKQNKKQDCN
jgi:hypothetical protein